MPYNLLKNKKGIIFGALDKKSIAWKVASFKYFDKISNMNLNNPSIVGFGISNRETYEKVIEKSKGAIIGSAIFFCKIGSLAKLLIPCNRVFKHNYFFWIYPKHLCAF